MITIFTPTELYPANQDLALNTVEELDLLGEGGEEGDINGGKGFVFSVLEVCLCLIVRQIPALNPTPLVSSTVQVKQPLVGNELSDLVACAVTAMEALPDLCSPAGNLPIFEIFSKLRNYSFALLRVCHCVSLFLKSRLLIMGSMTW